METLKPSPLARWLFREGMKQKELARVARVSQSAVSRAKLYGEARLTAPERAKIMRATGLKRL